MIPLLRAYVYAVRFAVIVTCAVIVTLLTWIPDRICGHFDDRS